MTKKIKAAFFDRDGTLIKDVSYLSRLDQIEFIPQALDVCRELQQHGYSVFIVTNQSGIARGFFDEAFVQKTHEHLQKRLRNHGVVVQACYYCPHHPTHEVVSRYKKTCGCRKPEPGMLVQAAYDFNIDLSRSMMIGDRDIDVEAGIAVGCRSFNIQELVQMPADVRRNVFLEKTIT